MKRTILVCISIISVLSATAENAFEAKLSALGIDKNACKDYSSWASVSINEPQCAYANLYGFDVLPDSLSGDKKGYIDFYDNNGNYFQKKVLVGLQGSGKTPKVSLAIEFCEDSWIGDQTTTVTIGDWVAQDSYHLKAFYEDGIRGTTEVAYQLYGQISSRSNCYPKAFPVAIYVNGDFYGMMAWQLKKHRDNYGLDKKTSSHVWLDGKLSNKSIWHSSVDWTAFEVRNPKDLYDMNGNDYDGDNPKELMDATSSAYEGKSKQKRCAEVKANIQALCQYDTTLAKMEHNGADAATMRNKIEELFDVQGLIDYRIFSLVTNNYDGFAKNWLWFTFDGTRWSVAPYGCELTFGYNSDTDEGYSLWPASQGSKKYDFRMTNSENDGPMRWITSYYSEDLKSCYTELRNNRVIDADNIASLFSSWINRIGETNYSEEWSRWPLCPIQLGQAESLDRIKEWITQRIQLLDAYIIEGAGINEIKDDSSSMCTYSIWGLPMRESMSGIQITRYADGTTKMLFRQR